MTSRPWVREVSSLPSWVCCFLTYLAVRTTDSVTYDRLTYATLLVREAMRHGGQGWLEYDWLFCQQAALDPNFPWNIIHPGLQATTILGQRSSNARTFCTHCQECDHSVSQCTIVQLQPHFHLPTARGTSSTNLRANTWRICISWNDRACVFPRLCSYRHICSNCFQPSQRTIECKSASWSWPNIAGNHPHQPQPLDHRLPNQPVEVTCVTRLGVSSHPNSIVPTYWTIMHASLIQ